MFEMGIKKVINKCQEYLQKFKNKLFYGKIFKPKWEFPNHWLSN